MRAYQICAVFVVLFLTQATYGKNVQESTDSTAQKQMLDNAFNSFMTLGQEYIASSTEISRNILKDESLIENDKHDIIQFKKDLKMFVEYNDKNSKKDVFTIWSLIASYVNTIKYYVEMPEEKKTPESKFILDILNKYNCQTINRDYLKKFDALVNSFIHNFEEHKDHLNESAVKWFKEFRVLTKFEQKLEALYAFLAMLE